jgi:hypothetical protein
VIRIGSVTTMPLLNDINYRLFEDYLVKVILTDV